MKRSLIMMVMRILLWLMVLFIVGDINGDRGDVDGDIGGAGKHDDE